MILPQTRATTLRWTGSILIAISLAPSIYLAQKEDVAKQVDHATIELASTDRIAGLHSTSLESKKTLGKITIGIDNRSGWVGFFSGRGKKLRELKPEEQKGSNEWRRLRTYYAPDVHPDRGRAVCMRCDETWTKPPKDVAPTLLEIECALVELSLQDDGDRILIEVDSGDYAAAPVYSPDGSKVAFLLNDDISINDAANGQSIMVIKEALYQGSDALAPYAQLMYLRSGDIYIRWSRDGGTLFVLGPQNPPEGTMSGDRHGAGNSEGAPLSRPPSGYVGILEVNVRSKSRRQHNLYMPMFGSGGGRYLGRHVRVLDDRWTWLEKPLPDNAATSVLFGSSEHPVLRPKFSPGGRFYFYLLFEQGWFWKTALMRYDTEKGDVKNINTIERGLYRE